jgi:hypothetical protein
MMMVLLLKGSGGVELCCCCLAEKKVMAHPTKNTRKKDPYRNSSAHMKSHNP